MVSPNRQGHIVATFPRESWYGRYRNITPRSHPTSSPPLQQRIDTTQGSGLSCRRDSESEPGNCA
ncbi:hypothetical protein J3A83DRAFT_4089821 [Scleroderma citrinum]